MGNAYAHEVPARVVLTVFVKADEGVLRVLVRAPLAAMRDVEFPERGPGYLDVAAADAKLREAAQLWLGDELLAFADGQSAGPGQLVSVRASRPAGEAFADYAGAVAHVRGPPLGPAIELPVEQALLDALFEFSLPAAASGIALEPRFAHLGMRTVTLLRFVTPDGGERLLRYQGNPGRIDLDPRWYQAAGRFLVEGVQHVLGGIDHLLFILCLVAPFRRVRPLVVLVTAFTLAHSVTLSAAVLGFAPQAGWFAPLVELLIAASVFYLALENLLKPRLERRWLVAFAFGLVHGFGFAAALGDELQFAGGYVGMALAAFNVGIELGQLAVVAVAMLLLHALLRRGAPERFVVGVLSVLVAHTAWHWLLERGEALLAQPFAWPVPTAAWWAGMLRWLLLAIAVFALGWVLKLAWQRWLDAAPASREL